MRLSEKTKERLWMVFAVSLIIKRCALPGIFGMLLIALGFTNWLGKRN